MKILFKILLFPICIAWWIVKVVLALVIDSTPR